MEEIKKIQPQPHKNPGKKNSGNFDHIIQTVSDQQNYL